MFGFCCSSAVVYLAVVYSSAVVYLSVCSRLSLHHVLLTHDMDHACIHVCVKTINPTHMHQSITHMNLLISLRLHHVT